MTRSGSTRRLLTALAAFLSVSAGIVLGISTVKAPHGYAAAYGFGGVWVLASLPIVVGLGCSIFPRTRLAGFILVAAGGLTLLAFYATIAVAKTLGLVSWR